MFSIFNKDLTAARARMSSTTASALLLLSGNQKLWMDVPDKDLAEYYVQQRAQKKLPKE